MRLLVFLALLQASLTWGVPVATVEGVRVPAWMERQGAQVPLTTGMELHASDGVLTGPGGRVLLRLSEGSEVRLGSQTTFELLRLDPPATPGGAFTGLLRVVRGALRFTSTLLSQSYQRDLDIRVATVNAGISGTDVWAKAAPDQNIVCLIEGHITVRQEGSAPLVLNNPLSFFVAPKDGEAEPVTSVTPEQLDRWIAQVALERGTGLITRGPWAVAVGSFRDEETAARALAALHRAGIPARRIPLNLNGKRWLRLAVTGFADRAETVPFIQRVGKLAEIRDAWAYQP